MKGINFLIYFFLLIFPLGQLSRLPLNFGGLAVSLNDFILALIIILWFFQKQRKKSFLSLSLGKNIIFFVLTALFSLLIALFRFFPIEVFISGLYLLRWIFYAFLYFIIADLLKRKKIAFEKILNLLLLAGANVAFLGILQYLFFPHIPVGSFLEEKWGFDPHSYRLFATFLDPNFAGIILILNFCLLFSYLLKKARLLSFWQKMISAVILLFSFPAILLTFSRSTFLAFSASFLVLSALGKTKKLRLFLIIIFISVLLFGFIINQSQNTGKYNLFLFRPAFRDWETSWTVIQKHPLFGAGFNTLRFLKRDYGMINKGPGWETGHSAGGFDASLFFVWATAGITGLSAYLLLWFRIIQKAWEKYKIDSQSVIPLAVLTSTAGLFVHSVFVNSLFYPHVMGWMWILIGLMEINKNEK